MSAPMSRGGRAGRRSHPGRRWIAWTLFSILLMAGCLNDRFYHPTPYRDGTLDGIDLPHETIFFDSADGTRLWGLFLPARTEPVGTVIHFHGNYGHLGYYLDQIGWLPDEGFNVFTFDYRGYGRSGGTPNREGIHRDAVAAVRTVSDHPRMGGRNLFLFGQSIGGANAVAVQSKNRFSRVRAVALEGTFASYRVEARDRMAAAVVETVGRLPCLSLQIWPLSFLAVTDGYSPDDLIGQISPVPVLIIHCAEDRTVDVRHARMLFKNARDPKQLWIIENRGHLEAFVHGEAARGRRRRLVDFFKANAGSETAPPESQGIRMIDRIRQGSGSPSDPSKRSRDGDRSGGSARCGSS